MEYKDKIMLESDIDYATYKVYLEPKLRYLDENYTNNRTIITYWGLFKKFILEVEKDLMKDLYEFSADEIKDMILSIPTTSMRIKQSVARLSSLYIDWALQIAKYKQGVNPFTNIDIAEISIINKRSLRDEYISMDRILEMAEVAHRKGCLNRSIAIVLLARLGLDAELVSEFRITDINKNGMFIRISEAESGRIYINDARILDWFNKANDECGFSAKEEYDEDGNLIIKRGVKDFILYKSGGRLIKSSNEKQEKVSSSVLYNGVKDFFECNGVKPISFKKLVRCAAFDDLMDIYKENGVLIQDNFKKVYEKYNPASKNNSSYFNLKKDFTIMHPEIKVI